MTVHSVHEIEPGFSPGQIFHDGCDECEARGRDLALGMAKMDAYNFARAWARAVVWNRDGVTDLSNAERPLLEVLWAIQIRLERLGFPIDGSLPNPGALHG